MAALGGVTGESDGGVDRLSSLPSALLPGCLSFLTLRELLTTAATSHPLANQLDSNHMIRTVWSAFEPIDVIRIEAPLSREEFVWLHWGSQEHAPAVWNSQPRDYQWAAFAYNRQSNGSPLPSLTGSHLVNSSPLYRRCMPLRLVTEGSSFRTDADSDVHVLTETTFLPALISAVDSFGHLVGFSAQPLLLPALSDLSRESHPQHALLSRPNLQRALRDTHTVVFPLGCGVQLETLRLLPSLEQCAISVPVTFIREAPREGREPDVLARAAASVAAALPPECRLSVTLALVEGGSRYSDNPNPLTWEPPSLAAAGLRPLELTLGAAKTLKRHAFNLGVAHEYSYLQDALAQSLPALPTLIGLGQLRELSLECWVVRFASDDGLAALLRPLDQLAFLRIIIEGLKWTGPRKLFAAMTRLARDSATSATSLRPPLASLDRLEVDFSWTPANPWPQLLTSSDLTELRVCYPRLWVNIGSAWERLPHQFLWSDCPFTYVRGWPTHTTLMTDRHPEDFDDPDTTFDEDGRSPNDAARRRLLLQTVPRWPLRSFVQGGLRVLYNIPDELWDQQEVKAE